MLRPLFLLIGLGSLALGIALPNVMDVTVDGSVSSSGLVSAVCALGTPNCVPGSPPLLTVPYSFSGTNTQLGAFTDSWSASTPIGGLVLSYADETTSVCIAQPPVGCGPFGGGDTLYVELTGGHDAAAVAWTAQEAESITVSFDLTEESVVTLYPSVLFGTASNGGQLLDSNGDVLLTAPLEGTSASITLQPGMYQLDASVSGGALGGELQSGNTTDSLMYLDAQFNPVPTPEPRGVAGAALLVIMACGYVAYRRHRTP